MGNAIKFDPIKDIKDNIKFDPIKDLQKIKFDPVKDIDKGLVKAGDALTEAVVGKTPEVAAPISVGSDKSLIGGSALGGGGGTLDEEKKKKKLKSKKKGTTGLRIEGASTASTQTPANQGVQI